MPGNTNKYGVRYAKRGTKRRRITNHIGPNTVDNQQTEAIKSLQRQIRKLQSHKELKRKFFSVNEDTTTNAITRVDLTEIGQGDSSAERDGVKIKITSIYYNMFMRKAVGTTGSVSIFRFLIVQAKGQSVAVGDIIIPNAGDFIDSVNFETCWVLYDSGPQMVSNLTANNESSGSETYSGSTYWSDKGKVVPYVQDLQYDAATAVDSNNNPIYLVHFFNNTSAVHSYNMEVRFTDY